MNCQVKKLFKKGEEQKADKSKLKSDIRDILKGIKNNQKNG